MGNDQDQDKNAALTSYAIYGAAGIQLAAAVIGLMFVGNYLDHKLSTTPWLAVTGTILGFIGGMINLVRILGLLNKMSDKKQKDSSGDDKNA